MVNVDASCRFWEQITKFESRACCRLAYHQGHANRQEFVEEEFLRLVK